MILKIFNKYKNVSLDLRNLSTKVLTVQKFKYKSKQVKFKS